MGIGYMDLVSSGGLEIKPLWIQVMTTVLKKKRLNLLDLLFAISDKYIASEKYPSHHKVKTEVKIYWQN